VALANGTLGSIDDAFNTNTLIAGRACRDALERVCRWQRDRGMADAPCRKP